MTITIQLSDKCKQIIKTSDKFEIKKTFAEQNKISRDIASDLSRKKYIKVELTS